MYEFLPELVNVGFRQTKIVVAVDVRLEAIQAPDVLLAEDPLHFLGDPCGVPESLVHKLFQLTNPLANSN